MKIKWLGHSCFLITAEEGLGIITDPYSVGGGIGYGKIKYLNAEHGEAVAIMRQLKSALDPDNIMNPGKIVEP